ncbi:MAG TPA: YncE family protein [Rhodopila sp.]|nr:YncE family protein [Rhodopila sp.]
MRQRRPPARLIIAAAAALLCGPHPTHAQAPPGAPAGLFTRVGDVPLGAATSRTDYESFDPASQRLYIAKMGAGAVIVFDTGQNRVEVALPGFPKATGILAVPERHRLYVSVPGAGLAGAVSAGLGMIGLSSGHGALAVLDTTTLHQLARLPAGVFPDGITDDPKDARIFVSDELGGAVMAFDATANTLLARIDTHGEVGNVRYDPLTARVYAPVQSRNALAVIDPATLHMVRSDPLPGGRHPHGLILAPGAAIGYVACDGDDRLLVVDLAAGRVIGSAPLGHDPDVLAIDPGLRRLYVAAESGTLSTFDITDARAPRPLGDVFVGKGAHAVAVDPVSHRLFLALADLDGQAVLRILVPARVGNAPH